MNMMCDRLKNMLTEKNMIETSLSRLLACSVSSWLPLVLVLLFHTGKVESFELVYSEYPGSLSKSIIL